MKLLEKVNFVKDVEFIGAIRSIERIKCSECGTETEFACRQINIEVDGELLEKEITLDDVLDFHLCANCLQINKDIGFYNQFEDIP